MFGLRSVTSFARDDRMSAQLLLVNDIGMAGFADLMTGMRDRMGGSLGQSVAAIMAILPEAVRHDGCAQSNECRDGDHHNGDEAYQMLGVLEQGRFSRPPEPSRSAPYNKSVMILDTGYGSGER